MGDANYIATDKKPIVKEKMVSNGIFNFAPVGLIGIVTFTFKRLKNRTLHINLCIEHFTTGSD
jgi:uncharacterized protein YlaI